MSGHANRNGAPDPGGRFPGLDVLSQAGHWDRVTADVILARVGPLPAAEVLHRSREGLRRGVA